MKECFRVRDYLNGTITHSDAIELCMKDAAKAENATILFDGDDFYIDRAILLPDNTEIVVDGCSIIQNDEVFDNVFRGKNLIVDENNPYGEPREIKPQKNIKIIGKNGAKIVGTAKNRIGFHSFFNGTQHHFLRRMSPIHKGGVTMKIRLNHWVIFSCFTLWSMM